MWLDPTSKDQLLPLLGQDKYDQVESMYLEHLRGVLEFKQGGCDDASSGVAAKEGIAGTPVDGNGATQVGTPSSAKKRGRSTLMSRLQNNSPASVIAASTKPKFDIELERRVYDAISPDDIALGMHTGSDGSVHFNVLKFWDKMKGRLPLHATLAFRVYAALPTEANCERVFSMAGRTVTKLRHKLGPKTLQALVIVGCHLKKNDDI